MSEQTNIRTSQKLGSMMDRLSAIASEMEAFGMPSGVKAMAVHIDSIVTELNFEQLVLLSEGPQVTFRNGQCITGRR